MQHKQKNSILLPLAVFAGLALLAWLLVTLVSGISFDKKQEKKEIQIRETQAEDAASQIDALVEANHGAQGVEDSQRRTDAAKLRAQLESGEVDVWLLMEKSAVLGDVRAADFARYGFMDESRVFAGESDTVEAIATHLDELKALDPEYIFLCYGLNDASVGVWNTPEEYAAALILQISQLNQAVPNATVVVSSILPVQEPALSGTPQWQNLPQLSAAVEAACVEYGIRFVNNDALFKEHPEVYGADGIRLEKDIYRGWAINLIVGAKS